MFPFEEFDWFSLLLLPWSFHTNRTTFDWAVFLSFSLWRRCFRRPKHLPTLLSLALSLRLFFSARSSDVLLIPPLVRLVPALEAPQTKMDVGRCTETSQVYLSFAFKRRWSGQRSRMDATIGEAQYSRLPVNTLRIEMKAQIISRGRKDGGQAYRHGPMGIWVPESIGQREEPKRNDNNNTQTNTPHASSSHQRQ